jgi:TPR repeat protein
MTNKGMAFFCVWILTTQPLLSESQFTSVNVDESFAAAVKLIEQKQYVDAVSVFKILAEQEVPEAQYNLSLLFFNGLGTPKNFRQALIWSWKAHLNEHETARTQVNNILDMITPDLQNAVAEDLILEFTDIAKTGNSEAALKLGITYTELLVEPDYPTAYVWLSIAQAYGVEEASGLLMSTTEELTVEEVIIKQDEASSLFDEINK